MADISGCWSVIYRSSGGRILDGFRERNGMFHGLQDKLDYTDTFFPSPRRSAQSSMGMSANIEIGVIMIHRRIRKCYNTYALFSYTPVFTVI